MSSNVKALIERVYRLEWNEPNLTFHEILRRMYIDKRYTLEEMSDQLNIGIGSVHNYLKQEGIAKSMRCLK